MARYIERAPLSLEKLSSQDDIVTYTAKDGAAHACLAVASRSLLVKGYFPSKTLLNHVCRASFHILTRDR